MEITGTVLKQKDNRIKLFLVPGGMQCLNSQTGLEEKFLRKH